MKITKGTLHEKPKYIFDHISLSFLRMRNILGKIVKKINSNLFFENLAFYEVMWKNTVETDRPQMTIWLTHVAC